MSYTDVFGDDSIPLSRNSYQAITLTGDLTLSWEDLAVSGAPAVSDIVHVDPTSPGHSLLLPAANQGSVGSSMLIRNVGANSFVAKDNAGGTIVTVAVGEAKFVYLTDVTTQAGVWSVIAFGVGTSSADSSTLAGYGLLAIGATLNQKMEVVDNTTDTVATASDRAKYFVFTGGSATFTLPALASVQNGYFVGVKNSGTGTITVDGAGAETIDGDVTQTLNPNESMVLVASQTAWFSEGRGRSVVFLFSKLTKSVAGNSDVTLSAAESAHQMLQFTGVLTGNINVIVPAVSAVYYVYNATTGAFSMTVKTAAGTGVEVQGGRRQILVCDSVNVALGQDSAAATLASLGDGSVGSPSLFFTLDSDLGFYRVGTNSIGIAGNNAQIARFSSSEVVLSQVLKVPDGAVGGPGVAFSSEATSGMYRIGAGEIGFSVSSTLALSMTSSAVKVKDSFLRIQDNADVTKQLAFECSGITAGQTRTVTIPDKSGTMAMTSDIGTAPGALADGAVGTPSLAFASDPDLGIYRVGVNEIGISGGNALGLSVAGAVAKIQNGTVAAPALALANDTGVGLYRVGAGEMGFAAGSALALSFTSTATKVKDSFLRIQDDGDATKQLAFQCSGITTGNTRTVTIPNKSGTMAMTSDITGGTTLGTEQATTSGTSIDFTGIPAGTKAVMLQLVGVSVDTSASSYAVQIGDAGGIETDNNYKGGVMDTANASSWTTHAQIFRGTINASFPVSGTIMFCRLNTAGTSWSIWGSISEYSATSLPQVFSGHRTLSGEMDRIRLTTLTGSPQFDLGSANITVLA